MRKPKGKQLDVVVGGHICFDIIPKFRKTSYKTLDKILVPGKLVNIDEPILSTGGPVTNTGLVLLKLGAKVEFMAKVGDDIFGNAVIEMIKQKTGIISEGIKKEKERCSPYTVCIALPGIDRIFLHHPGTNDTFGYSDVNFHVVKSAKLFHFGYPPLMRKLYLNNGRELVRIFRKVKSLGVTTSIDMALPDPTSESGQVNWNVILKNVLPYVDLFLPGIEETMFMLNPKRYRRLKNNSLRLKEDFVDHISGADFTQISNVLLGYGARIIGLKCSHRGYYIRTANKHIWDRIGSAKPKDSGNWANCELWAPSYEVKNIASALGSGDSAVAAFLVAFLKGKNVEDTIKYANIVGAMNLRAYDATSGIGNWKDVEKMGKNKRAKFNELKIPAPGWRRAQDMKIWIGPNDRR